MSNLSNAPDPVNSRPSLTGRPDEENPDPSERSSLVPGGDQSPPNTRVKEALVLCASIFYYIVMSVWLINYNKYLMSGPFPYSIALTGGHMVVSFLMSLAVYTVFGYATHPAMEKVNEMSKTKFVIKLFPLAIAFGVSVTLSNEAYRYCTVPFLQMCKELNIVFVYVASVMFALEKLSARTTTLLAIVLFGCTISIHGQVDFNAQGFTYQISSQMAEICKMLLQAYIMQSMKIDPLTMVMWMAPLCFAGISTAIWYSWTPMIITDAKACWNHLLMNSMVAFFLNHSVSYLLRISSGITMVLSGIVKDICIVSIAAMLFGAHLERIQIIGFTIAIMGIFAHSVVKSFPEVADEHGVIKGIYVVAFKELGPKRAD